MGPLIGKWEQTPLWLQALGKPAMRRHVVWAHFDEWEYGYPSTFNGLEDAVRRHQDEPAGWTEARLREFAKSKGWYVREGASVPNIHTGGWKHPFSVTAKSSELIDMLNARTRPHGANDG